MRDGVGKGNRAGAIAIAAMVAVVVAVAVGVFAWGKIAGGSYAVVHDGDGGETRLDLAVDCEVAVTTSKGTNVVAVRDGKVSVVEADCPNHDCMRQGEIDSAGQQIVCLPHGLWIEIASDGGDGAGADTDVVSR